MKVQGALIYFLLFLILILPSSISTFEDPEEDYENENEIEPESASDPVRFPRKIMDEQELVPAPKITTKIIQEKLEEDNKPTTRRRRTRSTAPTTPTTTPTTTTEFFCTENATEAETEAPEETQPTETPLTVLPRKTCDERTGNAEGANCCQYYSCPDYDGFVKTGLVCHPDRKKCTCLNGFVFKADANNVKKCLFNGSSSYFNSNFNFLLLLFFNTFFTLN